MIQQSKRTRTGKQGAKVGVMGKARRAWVNLGKYEVVVYDGISENDDKEYPAGVEPVRLAFTFGSGRPAMFHLTGLTEAELRAFKQMFDLAYETALPRVIILDNQAKEAYENGDDSFARSYRPIPTIFERERREPSHDEGLRDGPQTALDEVPDTGSVESGTDRQDVPGGEPAGVGTDHVQAEGLDLQDVRGVGGAD